MLKYSTHRRGFSLPVPTLAWSQARSQAEHKARSRMMRATARTVRKKVRGELRPLRRLSAHGKDRIMKWFRASHLDHVSRQARQIWDKVSPGCDMGHAMCDHDADALSGQQPEAIVVPPNLHADPHPNQLQHYVARDNSGSAPRSESTGAVVVKPSCDVAQGRRQRRMQPRRVVTHQTLTLPRTPYRGPLALAGFQIVLGYAWLVAGVDKVLLAGFPAMLGSLLTATIHGGMVPAPFATILEAVVVPHGTLFGLLTEWGEEMAGLGLIVAGLTALVATPLQHRLPAGGARLVALFRHVMNMLWPLAALGGLVMGLSFYVVDGAPWQGFMPSVAFGGALDEGFLLAMGSAVLLTAALAPRFQRVSRGRHPRAAEVLLQTRPAQSPRTVAHDVGKRA
jgi:hypothetical protein